MQSVAFCSLPETEQVRYRGAAIAARGTFAADHF